MRARKLIQRQRDRIYSLGKAGVGISLAGLVLARLEAWQTLRVEDRQRLQDLLAAFGKSTGLPYRKKEKPLKSPTGLASDYLTISWTVSHL